MPLLCKCAKHIPSTGGSGIHGAASVTKDQQVAIMDIAHLRNKFKQNYTSENWYRYKMQRNKHANLLKKNCLLKLM